MKTHTIKTPTAELMIVELPEKIDRCWVLVHSNHIWINNRETGDIHIVKGSYTLLGKPDEVREEDAEPLIPMYFDHEKTAVEYLIQMIESEIYWDVNPFPYERTESEIIADNLNHCRFITKEESKFWEAESRTFDRSRTLIFVKQ